MKKMMCMAVFALAFSSLVWAQTEEAGKDVSLKNEPETITLSGVIIDNKSVEKYIDQLDTFAPRYPKAQAVLPISVESGYSIYADGELYKFDDESNKKIVEFLQERSNVLKVIVKAKEVDEKLELVSIENAYVVKRGDRGNE